MSVRSMVFPLRMGPALALAALSAVLAQAGFPPFNLWAASLVCLAPLVIALNGQSPRAAFFVAWTHGLLRSVWGFHWLTGTIERFGGLGLLPAVGLLLVLSAYHGCRVGLAGWLGARAQGGGWPYSPSFAAAYIATEAVFPLLFPWYLATSVHRAAPELLQVAELGGPIAVGLVILAPSLALAEAITGWRRGGTIPWRPVGAGFLVPLLAALYGQIRMAQVERDIQAAPTVRLGLVQANRPMTDATGYLDVLLALTESARTAGAELVVWSESAVQNAYPHLTYTTALPRDITGTLGVPTLFGVRMVRQPVPPETSKERWNSVVIADASGAVLGRYDKHVLLPFGEYTPFGDQLPALKTLLAHTGSLTPGTTNEALPFGDHRLLALICYEDILAAYVNRAVVAGNPDLLVNVTNDSWFGDSAEPWIHLGEARLRAIEHRRFLVRATNSGPSGVVDANGRDVVQSRVWTRELVMAEARFMRSVTPYERWGEAPWWFVSVLSFGMALWKRR
ncbi:MAG: apolipoprotein N-acyltransferase [Myxococcales bacterium]|nr:apolipoprotein N-acyltransferase [Myxococcales bacterium]